MRVGIDFDNTIIAYDNVFRISAAKLGIQIPASKPNKTVLRDYIRTLPNGEITWQKIQADVYGPRIGEAQMFKGFESFIHLCRKKNIQTFIVSHKTKFAAQNPKVNLRDHALGWMRNHGFFDTLGFSLDHIFFENTRHDKIQQLKALNCTHIIDDLIEVLKDPQIPQNIKKIWFSQNQNNDTKLLRCQTWADITTHLLT